MIVFTSLGLVVGGGIPKIEDIAGIIFVTGPTIELASLTTVSIIGTKIGVGVVVTVGRSWAEDPSIEDSCAGGSTDVFYAVRQYLGFRGGDI